MPMVGRLAEPAGHGVGMPAGRIAMDLESGAVVPEDDADQEEPDRVLAEIGGNTADPQPPLRIGVVQCAGRG